MSHSKKRRALLAGVLPLTLASLAVPLAAAPAQATTDPWIVALGDSYISGEGGLESNSHYKTGQPSSKWGRYQPGTTQQIYNEDPNPSNPQPPNPADPSVPQVPFCHRSITSPIEFGVPGLAGSSDWKSLNLACSGAQAVSVVNAKGLPKPGVDFGDAGGVPGQAAQLREFAKKNDVKVVTLSIGGNDFGFADFATDCVSQEIINGTTPYGCQITGNIRRDTLPARLAFTRDRVTQAIKNVTQAMKDAGKAPDSWKLVYVNPVLPIAKGAQTQGAGVSPGSDWDRSSLGCPLGDKSIDWIHDKAYTVLTHSFFEAIQSSQEVLNGTPVVLVDTKEAFAGHRLCEKGTVRAGYYNDRLGNIIDKGPIPFEHLNGPDTSWVVGANQDEILGSTTDPHKVTGTLHPNYWGQRALSNCLEQVVEYSPANSIVQCSSGSGVDGRGRPNMNVKTFAPIPFKADDGSRLVSLDVPKRAYDSREVGTKAKLKPGETRVISLADAGVTLPTDTVAANINLTAVGPTSNGLLSVQPANEPTSTTTSALNYSAVDTSIANAMQVRISPDKKIKVTNSGRSDVHVLVDLQGYFVTVGKPGSENGLSLLPLNLEFVGQGNKNLPSRTVSETLAPGETKSVDVVGTPTPPGLIAGVAYELTVKNTKGSGYVTVLPDGATTDPAKPTSSINYSYANDVVINGLMTKVVDNKVQVTNGSKTLPVDFTIDTWGWLTDVTSPVWEAQKYRPMDFHPTAPYRTFDSRSAQPAQGVLPLWDSEDATNGFWGLFSGQGSRGPVFEPRYARNANGGVTNGLNPTFIYAGAVAANLTVTGTTGAGSMNLFQSYAAAGVSPDTDVMKNTPAIEWAKPGTTRANASTIPMDNTQALKANILKKSTNGQPGTSAHAVVDIYGYWN